MKSATVRINELRLRVPGLTREQARSLGETVAKRLAGLPIGNGRSHRIPGLTVHVQADAATSVERMADQIVSGIKRGLGSRAE